MVDGRNRNGTFAPGNPGGPGRPRRPAEKEYLAVLTDVADLDTWREICKRAAEQAKAGNPKAREWLSRLLLGIEPPSLSQIAAQEQAGPSDDDVLSTIQQLEELFAKIQEESSTTGG
jgi:hypothetical protein